LKNQIKTPNPLASLKDQKTLIDEIFDSSKEDRGIKILIRKDVERTMQELEFFRNSEVSHNLEDLLYVWAKEYPDFKYQQGMNEILAVVVVCLASELIFE